MWIEENEDEKLKEIFIVAARISCKASQSFFVFVLRKR
jgi:hypothetical protein